MRKLLRRAALTLAVLAAASFLFVAGSAFFFAQRADYGWAPAISRPAFTTEHPRVLFDEGHGNASTAGFAGRYWPFARLLRADGYAVERGHAAFSVDSLRRARVLVIANASGAPKPQLFGLNVPVPTRGHRRDPAFAPAEIEAVRAWVEAGGSLLLIADHAPFGEAAFDLGAALGVTMHKGAVEVPGEASDPLLFSAGNGRLGSHPILAGDGPAGTVSRVMTYTGQSLDGPPDAAVLLRLPATAREAVPLGDGGTVERPAGPAQGIAFELGRGRVVVLGEAGIATAQVASRVPYGMNTHDNDNARFVRNAMAWLARKL
jgi:hypothetical protein